MAEHIKDDDLEKTTRFQEKLNALRYAFLLEQIPLLYAVMLTASLLCALVYQRSAPILLVTAIPVALCIVTTFRAMKWIRLRDEELTPEQIALQLKITAILGPVIAFAFTIWAVALFDYGNEYQKALVGMLVITCMTLTAIILSILPRASLAAVAAAGLPFAVKFAFAGSILLVCMLMAFCAIAVLLNQVLQRYSHAFSDLIDSQHDLTLQNRQVVETKRALIRIAYRDSLSGLGNKAKYKRNLDKLIRLADRDAGKVFAGIIDINGFRSINDAYGFDVGDAVLREVASRLRRAVASHGIVNRYETDEFAFALTNEKTAESAMNFAERMCHELCAPIMVGDHSVLLTVSCGMSAYPDNGLDAATLINRAHYALHDAKTDIQTPVSVFTHWHESRIQRRSRIEQALRHAIARDELDLVYQPIVDLADGRIASCEALARWHDPELGNVRPDEFIPIAEQTGIITDLTYTLLRTAARDACAWPGEVLLSFNLSACEITAQSSGLRILTILNEMGLDPRRFEVEITETAFLKNFDAANATIRGLRATGIGIALDDFGTGQSGLQYVERIDFDKLKIDRAFVATLETSEKTRQIVKAIAGMCKSLKIKTVAEGIEEHAQAEIMRTLGCSFGQGYLFDRPLPQAELLERFARDRRTPVLRRVSV